MNTYPYIPSLVDVLPLQVTAEHSVESPVLYSGFSLVILFTVLIVYTHQSQSPTSSHPPLPPLESIDLFSDF